jgi:translation elongation factor EF-G
MALRSFAIDRSMYPDYPIEQLFSLEGTPFQQGFAAKARDMIPADEEFVLQPTPKGLIVLGRNETALQPPAAVLREIYGARLQARPPAVRLIEGAVLQQPVMQVRISAGTEHLHAIKGAMAKRGAPPAEEYVRAVHCVLRYEAPLAGLLGLPAELAELTEGKARHRIVLSHYAPLPPPGGKAA